MEHTQGHTEKVGLKRAPKRARKNKVENKNNDDVKTTASRNTKTTSAKDAKERIHIYNETETKRTKLFYSLHRYIR